ncbi:MAG: NAD(P)(+) transhydrogenase (Re/Si-specific) subunit beta, partial [Planctomycetes bacterium]|nr:NAD(P)(+) transhydrogenase (Re/Si-specific) subunit beta [Planctomycetota bacterium]
SAIGMLIAIVTTLTAMTEIRWLWIIAGAGVGTLFGVFAARLVKMTSMPEMVGLFNGFGGMASLLVGWSEFHGAWATSISMDLFTTVAIFLTILIGGITFSGSLVAFGKLAALLPGKPILYKGQNLANAVVLLVIMAVGVFFCTRHLDQLESSQKTIVYLSLVGLMALALLFGVISTIRIGGADMPVVICLLNSYSGLAACAAGF